MTRFESAAWRGIAPAWARVTAIAFAVTLAGSVSLAQKVPCTDVLSELNRAELRDRGRRASAKRIANSLGTSPNWVQRCALAYGRDVDIDPETAKRRESQESAWESRESEELGREEMETAGDVVVDPVPYTDKGRQRGFRRTEREWEPDYGEEWKADAGREWSPYLYDPFRTEPDDNPGVVRK